jgi:hypothetical protein
MQHAKMQCRSGSGIWICVTGIVGLSVALLAALPAEAQGGQGARGRSRAPLEWLLGMSAAPPPASPAPPGTGSQGEAEVHTSEGLAADKTGTNPVNLQRTLILFNEYQGRRDGHYINFLNFRYIEPFSGNKAAVRLTLPLVLTDLGEDTEFGLGDFNLRVNYIPRLTPQYGLFLGLETSWDTASDDTLGAGRNWIAPVVIYVKFLPGKTIFAPAVQQLIDIGGDDDRRKINQTVFDFYYVKPAKNGWWILDPTLLIDYEGDTSAAGQVELERGFVIGPQGKGVASWYLRPGVGIGAHRAYDWNIELGYKLVGF